MIRSFPSEATVLHDIRVLTRDQAERYGFGKTAVEELTLAVSEAATNAIRHTDSREVTMAWRREGDCVVVEIADQGQFVKRVPLQELGGEGGRGILIMTAFCDEVSISEGTPRSPGTTVTLTKCKHQ